jgi:hypothetical protein
MVAAPGWLPATSNEATAAPAAVRSAQAAALPQAEVGAGRIRAVDFARGLAVCLMILSHGVNGMLSFEQIPDAGMLLHALTKFASSLFILVFGIALAVAFVPTVQRDDWPRRRLKLVLTGLVVLFWYKVLTVVEMAQSHPPAEIVDALLYRGFPSYVEILGFYAIALLWIPFVLPLWARMPLAARLASPVLMALASWWLLENFDFFGSHTLQALLVEHEDYYTWGQLSRGPLVLAGLVIGGLLRDVYAHHRTRLKFAAALAGAGVLCLTLFAAMAAPALTQELMAIARNAGKHPPELLFMLFSIGGALLLLAAAFAGGETLARIAAPVTLIGSAALQAFVFHIVVVFVVFRFLLGYVDSTTYSHALTLTLALIAATAAWIALTRWIRARRA